MSTIQAKVVVYEVKESKWADGTKVSEEIIAQPVYGTGEENKSYSEATPSGKIELLITNKNAFGFFVKGQEYYVNFIPAEPQAN